MAGEATAAQLGAGVTFEDFIAKFPEAKQQGKNFMVRCPAHGDKNASLSIAKGRDGIVLKCFAGCAVKEIAASLGLQVRDLFFNAPKKDFQPKYKPIEETNEEPKESKLVCSYSYTDALGRELYQALRYEPKTFRQRSKDPSGKWRWSMEGVERVLYRLPEIVSAKRVWIVEGEKDADRLAGIGIAATTNVGGAKKWLDAYSETLKGKEVIICGDSDKPGQEHVQQVFESVSQTAESVRIVKLPEGIKDVSDFIAERNGESKGLLEQLASDAIPHYKGIKLPFYTMASIEPLYKRAVKATANARLDLGAWLPSLRRIRPLWPGEFILFVADTGVGKTAILQNLSFHAKQLYTNLFEQELPKELLYERYLAMMNRMRCDEIERTYRDSDDEIGAEILSAHFGHIQICEEPGLSPERLEELTRGSELIHGQKPQLCIVDYVQLMRGRGSSKYEKATDIAESLKRIAKSQNVIMAACSQVTRPDDKRPGEYQPGLHSAKDSGAFENSAGVVISCWRDKDDPTLMNMKVVKSTKGGAGTLIQCNFEGEIMRITERAKTTGEEI